MAKADKRDIAIFPTAIPTAMIRLFTSIRATGTFTPENSAEL